MRDSQESLASLVKQSLCEACSVDPATVEGHTSLVDLGMDSFSLTAVVTYVETSFERELSADDVLELLQAETLTDLIARFATALEQAKETT